MGSARAHMGARTEAEAAARVRTSLWCSWQQYCATLHAEHRLAAALPQSSQRMTPPESSTGPAVTCEERDYKGLHAFLLILQGMTLQLQGIALPPF